MPIVIEYVNKDKYTNLDKFDRKYPEEALQNNIAALPVSENWKSLKLWAYSLARMFNDLYD